MKIGVFICHCGSNIAGTVDCGKVAEIAKTYPDVAFSTDTMYTCSEPGQEEIVAAIKEHKLDGVVVASCTPRMHEPTFRRTVERAGLNKYMFEMANIREHVSWIGKDKEANTNKAAELVRIAVEKLRRDNPLFSKSFESTKRVLVIGGGVAGIQAAKHNWELIPMCHPLPLTGIDITFALSDSPCMVEIRAAVTCTGVTGVEMEALTAVSVAALTIYDMCKAVDRGMVIKDILLLEKDGGKSGHYIRG